MPKHNYLGDDEEMMSINANGDPSLTKEEKRQRGRFWRWGCIFLILVLMGLAIAALVLTLTEDAHWTFDEDDDVIKSRHDGADVEVMDGGNLIIHNRIIDSGEHTAYEKITLDPAFGPSGPDLLFGAANATYTRIQAFFAIGFRVWDRLPGNFIPIGGIFAANGLFGEDALSVVIGNFATFIHGPIIGTGPAILIISDEDAKENIQSLDSAELLGNVARLEPRSFDWKGASENFLTAKQKASMEGVQGFVAQEVSAVLPRAVHTTSDYLPTGTGLVSQSLMDYNYITTQLVGAVQAMWANGVNTAGDSAMVGPQAERDIAPCFNATAYPTERQKARCICNTQTCGANPTTPTCKATTRACGSGFD